MTPQEFIERRKKHRAIIAKAEELIQKDYEEASKCPVPINLVPAKREDIVPGAVIWRTMDDPPFWVIAGESVWPDGGFHDEEGCFYGLLKYSFVERKES